MDSDEAKRVTWTSSSQPRRATLRLLALVAMALLPDGALAERVVDPLVAELFTAGASWTFAGTVRTVSWEEPAEGGRPRKQTQVEKLRTTCRVAAVKRFTTGAATKIECSTKRGDRPFVLAGVYLATRHGLVAADKLPANDRELTDATRREPLLPFPARARVKREKDEDTQYSYRAVRRVLRLRGRKVAAWCGSVDGGPMVDRNLVDPGGYEICLGEGRPVQVRTSDRSAITVEMEASLVEGPP